MSFWDPGWRLVIGTLVVLAGVVAVAIYEGLYILRLTFLTRNPSIGYWRRHGNAPSQSGRETLLFQTIWMMRTASQKGEYSEMCSGVTLRPAWKGLRSVGAYTPARQSFGVEPILRLPNSSGSSSTE